MVIMIFFNCTDKGSAESKARGLRAEGYNTEIKLTSSGVYEIHGTPMTLRQSMAEDIGRKKRRQVKEKEPTKAELADTEKWSTDV